MQTSKIQKSQSALAISSIFIILSLVSSWIFQNSINNYYYITYNKTSPLEKLNDYPAWKTGAKFYELVGNLLNPSDEKEEFVLPKIEEKITLESLKSEEENLAQKAAVQLKQAKGARDLSSIPEEQKAEIKTVSAQEAERAIKDNQQIIASSYENLSIKEELELTRTPLSFDNNFANPPKTPIVLESLKGIELESLENSDNLENSQIVDNRVPNNQNQWGWEGQTYEPSSNGISGFTESPAPQVKATKSSKGGSAALNSGNSVYLVGDSMMQGVAPFLQQWLSKSGYKSINQAKPSSGLVQNTVKNWPVEIENTLAKNPNISLMVMFIGQNDTLNFISNKKVVGFQSPQWENLYSSKMNQILSSAEKRGVKVIWIGIPPMRSEKYERKMSYLDNLMRKNMRNRGIFIPTRNLVSDNGKYADIKYVNGKQVKVRNKDGIHLSFDGYKLVANEVKKYINIR